MAQALPTPGRASLPNTPSIVYDADPHTVADALADHPESYAPSARADWRRRAWSRGWARWLAVFMLPLACSRDEGAASHSQPNRRSSAGAIELASAPYQARELHQLGSITGVVLLDDDAPRDSLVVAGVDQEFCGPAIPDSSIVRTGDSLSNVVVWLADVREGKAMPLERRTEIINVNCRLEPRVQAVVAGTTVNVRNDDRLAHVTRFSLAGANDTISRVPLTGDGQVVPNEHIAAKAGLVAVTCEVHPWTRGFIAVFESPYFAVTDARGRFRLDSVPPGKYRLVAWHERGTRQVQQSVEVGADGEAKVEVRVRVR